MRANLVSFVQISQYRVPGERRTVTGKGAEGDVLLGLGGSLGRHCGWDCRGWNMEKGKEKSGGFEVRLCKKVGVCPSTFTASDWSG